MWNTVGHAKAVNILKRSFGEGRVSHAYLLTGPRHVGKMTLALDLACVLNCVGDDRPCGRCEQCSRITRAVHADVQVIAVEQRPDGDRSRVLIGIDQIRQVQREASLRPYEGSYRVFIFDGVDKLSEAAANSLLKTLEEPPDQVVLVLLASDASDLLPTIVSRCQLLELRPLPRAVVSRLLESDYGVEHGKAEEIARLSGGRPGWAVQAATRSDLLDQHEAGLREVEGAVRGTLAERFDYAGDLAAVAARDREAARQTLTLWLEWWRDVLLVSEGLPEFVTNLSMEGSLKSVSNDLSSVQMAGAIEDIDAALYNLDHNVIPRLALEDLMLRLPRPNTGRVRS